MANIEASWHQPVFLVDGSENRLPYSIDNSETLPEEPGVYVFCRMYGEKVIPLYIGKALNIRKRVCSHLKTNVRLMHGIRESGTGKYIVLACTVVTGPGRRVLTMLNTLERGLIENALSEGYELLNIQLTKLKVHRIEFSRNRTVEKMLPRTMLVRAA